jgi:hypothetical protein
MQSVGMQAQTRLALVRPRGTSVLMHSKDSAWTALRLRGVYRGIYSVTSPPKPKPIRLRGTSFSACCLSA